MNCDLNTAILVDMSPGDVEGLGEKGCGRVMLVGARSHELLMQSGAVAQPYGEACLVWMAQLFLRRSRGAYLLGKDDCCQLLHEVDTTCYGACV
jgi:hypothetical protein